MKKTIYHGSKDKIKIPIYGYGKSYNDYGLGFYCTEEIDLAKDFGNYYVHPNKEISCVHCTEQFFKIKESYKSLIDHTTEIGGDTE
jgi:hypothetical protein